MIGKTKLLNTMRDQLGRWNLSQVAKLIAQRDFLINPETTMDEPMGRRAAQARMCSVMSA